MAGSKTLKNIKKTSTCSNKKTQKELNNITQIFRWKHISFLPTPTPFFKGEDKVFKNKMGNQKKMGNFHFYFLTISYHGNCFRKSRLGGKLILEKILPGTFKNWPDHADLLVFCLKFKLSLVWQYLNCYYKITNDCWDVPEKSK